MKAVLNYKKPLFWICVVLIIVLIGAVVLYFILQCGNSKIDDVYPEIIKWQKSGSDVRGISLEIVDFDTSAENPSIVVKWTDNTGKDYGTSQEYYIFKESDGKWESCGAGFWNSLYINPAEDVWLWDYSLKNFNLSEPGKYRFESTLSENEKIWVEFYLEEGLEIGKIHESYSYDSGDIIHTPYIILNEDNTYSLSFSSLSSYISFGTYEISENTLTLRSDDERGVFVFTVKGDTLVFHAEESKGVWGYRQPDGTSVSTIPDGAVFEETE